MSYPHSDETSIVHHIVALLNYDGSYGEIHPEDRQFGPDDWWLYVIAVASLKLFVLPLSDIRTGNARGSCAVIPLFSNIHCDYCTPNESDIDKGNGGETAVDASVCSCDTSSVLCHIRLALSTVDTFHLAWGVRHEICDSFTPVMNGHKLAVP